MDFPQTQYSVSVMGIIFMFTFISKWKSLKNYCSPKTTTCYNFLYKEFMSTEKCSIRLIKSSQATSLNKRLNGELPFNHLTWLVAREDFIIHSCHESSRSYIGYDIVLFELLYFMTVPLSGHILSTETKKTDWANMGPWMLHFQAMAHMII
jgi:hypothetical protein